MVLLCFEPSQKICTRSMNWITGTWIVKREQSVKLCYIVLKIKSRRCDWQLSAVFVCNVFRIVVNVLMYVL